MRSGLPCIGCRPHQKQRLVVSNRLRAVHVLNQEENIKPNKTCPMWRIHNSKSEDWSRTCVTKFEGIQPERTKIQMTKNKTKGQAGLSAGADKNQNSNPNRDAIPNPPAGRAGFKFQISNSLFFKPMRLSRPAIPIPQASWVSTTSIPACCCSG